MNQKQEKQTEHVAPLDAFERRWVDAMNRPEPEASADEVGFAAAVLARWAAERDDHRPHVLARIGWAPFAAAAALLLTAAVGWAVLRGQTEGSAPGLAVHPALAPDDTGVADGSADSAAQDTAAPSRVAERSEAERRAMAQQLALGTIITASSDALVQPTTGLAKSMGAVAGGLNLKSFAEGLANPVPDPAEVLPPRNDGPRG